MPICLLHDYSGFLPCPQCPPEPMPLWSVPPRSPSVDHGRDHGLALVDLADKIPAIVYFGTRGNKEKFDRLLPYAINKVFGLVVPATQGMQKLTVEFAETLVTAKELNQDTEDFEIFLGVAWKLLATYFEHENGVPNADPRYCLGLSKSYRDFGGVRLHFTQRTRVGDDTTCLSALRELILTIRGLIQDKDTRSQSLHKSINLVSADALVRYAGATEREELMAKAEEIGDRLRSDLALMKFVRWVYALSARWTTVMNAPTPLLHVIVDRAGLKKAFGGVSSDHRATPEAFMTNNQDSLQKQIFGSNLSVPFVKVNLDATGTATLRATLAHEIAHALGANPTKCSPNGHMAEASDYLKWEEEHGPKMLFDAYFFEALIDFLNGVSTQRMQEHAKHSNVDL